MSEGSIDHQKPPVLTLDEERRRVLSEADEAPFKWIHMKTIMVAGVGFFTDAYDIFAISIVSTMLGYVYRAHNGHANSTAADLGIKIAQPVGTVFGQVIFGWLADVVGRKKMYGIELMIILLGTFGQVLAGSGHGVNIYNVLIVYRFIMGVGIGGDYPLSAVISSEFANVKNRGRIMTAVFASQGWGQLTGAIVALVVVTAFKDALINDNPLDPKHVDNVWRIVIGLGMIPASVALYFRLTIPETPRFTMDVERNLSQAEKDVEQMLKSGSFSVDPDSIIQRVEAPKASWKDFFEYFGQWKHGKVLLGTAYSWFALDVAFYGISLNSTIILSAIGFGGVSAGKIKSGFDIYNNLRLLSIGNIIISLGGAIPGYYAAMCFVDSWGRKKLQMMGFVVSTLIFCAMGFGYDAMIAHTNTIKAFVVLYCLVSFFLNFGPNTTTFIVPGEAFPTRYRSTAHGISAASGKVGSIIAQVGFAQLKNIGGSNKFIGHIMEIFAFFMLTGAISTLLIPETKQKSLEELSYENQEGFVKGVSKQVVTRDGLLVSQQRV